MNFHRRLRLGLRLVWSSSPLIPPSLIRIGGVGLRNQSRRPAGHTPTSNPVLISPSSSVITRYPPDRVHRRNVGQSPKIYRSWRPGSLEAMTGTMLIFVHVAIRSLVTPS